MIVSPFPLTSGITAKMDGVTSYHDNIEHNDDFTFFFKKMAARFPEISGKGIQKLAEKQQTKIQLKLLRHG